MKKINDKQIHYVMTFLGGYMGTYALLVRAQNFGSAQTGNIMEMAIDLVGRDYREVLIRIGALIVFSLSLCVSSLLTNHTKLNMKKLTLLVEGLLLALSAFVPADAEPVLALYPIFAASSFQWGTYCGGGGFSSASIFSTNNLKQAVTSWAELAAGNKALKPKAVFFTITVCSFTVGALIGAAVTVQLWVPAIALGILPLILTWWMLGKIQ